jgi:hypothetical protein
MRRASWLAFILGVTALGAVACNGGGTEAPTPEATLPSRTPSGTAIAAPFPTPIITDNLLEYPAKGYSVRFPEGWSVDANVVAFGGLTADAFFAPEEIAGVQPNMSVTQEELTGSVSQDTYLNTRLELVERLGARDIQEPVTRTVSGVEASLVTYSLTADSTALVRTDVVFVTEGTGWLISLTVPEGEEANYRPVLDEFLDSFELLSPPEPASDAE